ncbi:hypothetical protein GC173_13485 [bacterium]|nr:hypothetical protein [bacterium]
MAKAKTTFFHCPGNSMKHVAFVLSCPGEKEVNAKDDQGKPSPRPAAGTTGNNLDTLIGFLAEKRPEKFEAVSRYEYRICNSSKRAHWKEKTGDSQPDCAEIADAENLARLGIELKGAKYAILFGERARCVWALLPNKPAKVVVVSHVKINHPGGKGLNAIKEDLKGKEIISAEGDKKREAENTKKRLAVLAKRILDELEKQPEREKGK